MGSCLLQMLVNGTRDADISGCRFSRMQRAKGAEIDLPLSWGLAVVEEMSLSPLLSPKHQCSYAAISHVHFPCKSSAFLPLLFLKVSGASASGCDGLPQLKVYPIWRSASIDTVWYLILKRSSLNVDISKSEGSSSENSSSDSSVEGCDRSHLNSLQMFLQVCFRLFLPRIVSLQRLSLPKIVSPKINCPDRT